MRIITGTVARDERPRQRPVPPLRDDDHVRGARRTRRSSSSTRDFACPRCAVAAQRLRDAARPRRLPPLRAEGQAPARRRRSRHAAEAAARQGAFWAVPRRAVRRPGPHRRPAPVGALRARSGLDLDRFEADRRARTVAAERVRARRRATALRAGRHRDADAPTPGLRTRLGSTDLRTFGYRES